MKAQILVVEDQPATLDLICDVLKEEGFEIQQAQSLAGARDSIKRAAPELLILDRGLPDGDGLDFVKELRAEPKWGELPVLILTAKKAVEDRVLGLKGGADDYLAKPFNTEELVARVEALLRRAGKTPPPPAQTVGELKLEFDSRRAFAKGKEVPLSAKEFDLLWFMISNKNRVLTRDFLLQHVWGYEEGLDLTTKVVDVTVSHLREKLGTAGSVITAVRGFGYRLDA
ncbi:MAG: response regulator transcription factor [Elusimicrobiota bacterium]|jgi:two-component system alkaline phosphatase synthesis response regulator PhoP